MALTPHVGLTYFGGNIPGTLTDNGARFTGADRLTIDRLLYLLALSDRHVDFTADLDPGVPTTFLDDTGSLPGGMTYTYVVTLIGTDGIESLPSEEVSVTTPELLEAPIAPDIEVGDAGTLAPGLYLYALTAIRGAEESVLGDQVSVTLVPGETSVELAMPLDVPAGVESWQVWRMEIGDVGWTRVVVADVLDVTVVDDGSVPANPDADTLTAAPPSANAGVNIYAVEVTLHASDQALLTAGEATAWRLYRTETSSTFPSASLVHHVSETTDEEDPEAPVLTYWVDEGEDLITGAPPETLGRLRVTPYVLDHADALPDPADYPEYYPIVVDEMIYIQLGGAWQIGPVGPPGPEGVMGPLNTIAMGTVSEGAAAATLDAVAYGSELCTNGAFDANITGWSQATVAIAWDASQRLKLTSTTASVNQYAIWSSAGGVLTPGVLYKVSATLTVPVNGRVSMEFRDSTGFILGVVQVSTNGAGTSTISALGYAPVGCDRFRLLVYGFTPTTPATNDVAYVDDVSVKMVIGQKLNLVVPAGPSGIVIATHGTNASYARPAGTLVYWKGTVKPTNALNTDFWMNV